jgi:glycosyltransferase involved in cell wall biosynthesis
MPIVLTEIPSTRLEIYGEGPKKVDLQKLAKELSIDHVIDFNKYVAVEELYSIMKQVDIGVVPTLDGVFAGEALSTKSLEFLAMDTPVVISRTKVSEHYYDDSMVTFFQQGDHFDLAKRIIELYQHPERREAQVQNARIFNEKHNWENYKRIYYATVDGIFEC